MTKCIFIFPDNILKFWMKMLFHMLFQDRSLIPMCRGKMYRCVGEYRERQQKLNCVSVREASQNELQAYRKLLAVANFAVKKLA